MRAKAAGGRRRLQQAAGDRSGSREDGLRDSTAQIRIHHTFDYHVT